MSATSLILWIVAAIACALGVGLFVLYFQADTLGLRWLKWLARRRFPSVPQLSTGQLAEWLAHHRHPAPFLLDVRRPEEYRHSHLPGAEPLPTDITLAAFAETLPRHQPVVLYCCVGYRASEIATRLMKLGFDNVFSLEGSIFEWANENHPLESGHLPVSTVHPSRAFLARLLKPGKSAVIR